MKDNYAQEEKEGIAAFFEKRREESTKAAIDEMKRQRVRPYMLGVGFSLSLIGLELMRQVSWKVAAGAFMIWWAQNIFKKFK